MRILKVEINEFIEIVEYGPNGRFVLTYLGIFDSKRQAVKAIEENFKVREREGDKYSFEILESEE